MRELVHKAFMKHYSQTSPSEFRDLGAKPQKAEKQKGIWGRNPQRLAIFTIYFLNNALLGILGPTIFELLVYNYQNLLELIFDLNMNY